MFINFWPLHQPYSISHAVTNALWVLWGHEMMEICSKWWKHCIGSPLLVQLLFGLLSQVCKFDFVHFPTDFLLKLLVNSLLHPVNHLTQPRLASSMFWYLNLKHHCTLSHYGSLLYKRDTESMLFETHCEWKLFSELWLPLQNSSYCLQMTTSQTRLWLDALWKCLDTIYLIYETIIIDVSGHQLSWTLIMLIYWGVSVL